MANPFTQYLKETRSELNHVAWPTQQQTAVFTALVIAISLGIAAYVGVLDYGFREALFEVVNVSGNLNASNAIQVTQQPVNAAASTQTTGSTGSPQSTQAPLVSGPSFTIPGATTNSTSK